MEEIPSINCCICRSDTTAYAIIRCRHKIGIVCFLTMIKNKDYKCPLCREVFAVIDDDSDSDPEDHLDDDRYNQLDDQIDEIQGTVHQLQRQSTLSTATLDQIQDQLFNRDCLTYTFILLMLIINNVFNVL